MSWTKLGCLKDCEKHVILLKLPRASDEGESTLPVLLGPRLGPELDGRGLPVHLPLEGHGHGEEGHLGQALIVQFLRAAARQKENVINKRDRP